MKYMLVTVLVLLFSCSTGRIKLINREGGKVEQVHATKNTELTDVTLVDYTNQEQSFAETSDNVVEIAEHVSLTEKFPSLQKIIAHSPTVIDIQKSVSKTKKTKDPKSIDPEKDIKDGMKYLALSLIAICIAILMIVLTLISGTGLPTLFFAVASLILFIIGAKKHKRGYDSFMTYSGNKDVLYKKYKRVKILKKITVALMLAWILLFVILLLIPVINAAGNLVNVVIGGSINVSLTG